MIKELPHFTDAEILAARPSKNAVDVRRPYAWLLEDEYSDQGILESVATLFLTNRECPFRCLMCDLWKNTTDMSLAVGDIPAQIDFAFQELGIDVPGRKGNVRQVKLYNSGNFFDAQAINRQDWPGIADRLVNMRRVIVENHPRLCNQACLDFQGLLPGELEVALGLETVHPQILPALNKQMTLDDFQRAVEFLRNHGIAVRAFILLKPPSLEEEEGVEWAIRSMEQAFAMGVQCCSVVPTRVGNGIMEQLATVGAFQPPRIESMERVLAAGLSMQQGRVFMDLWDVEQFCHCTCCTPDRLHRLETMNRTQQVAPPVQCSRTDCGSG